MIDSKENSHLENWLHYFSKCKSALHYFSKCKSAPHYFSKCKSAPHYFSKCNSALHYFSKCNLALHYFSKCKSAPHYFSKCKSEPLFNLSRCTVQTVAADFRRGEHIPKMRNNIGRKSTLRVLRQLRSKDGGEGGGFWIPCRAGQRGALPVAGFCTTALNLSWIKFGEFGSRIAKHTRWARPTFLHNSNPVLYQLRHTYSMINIFLTQAFLYCTAYYTISYYTIQYYTILYYTILYYTILYYTILYYTILYTIQYTQKVLTGPTKKQ